MKTTTKLRQMLNAGQLIVVPFVLNAMHAKIAESVGCQAVYMTGAGTAAERGFPDVGLLTLTEMAANAKFIAHAVDIPVVCDADTGYGNPLNVRRTVQEYESAGVAGMHIEDQLFPKKCGLFEGKHLIPQEEAVQKIRAALDARTDPDFVIIARYDAYATDLADLPRIYNGDLMHTQGVAKLGCQLMICGSTIWLVYKQVKAAFEELMEPGRVDPERYGTRWDVAGLLGLEQVYELEKKYGVTAVPIISDHR